MLPGLSRVVSKYYGTYCTLKFMFLPQFLLILLVHDSSAYHSVDTISAATEGCSKLNQSPYSLTDSEKLPLYFLVMAPYPDCPPFNPSWKGGPAVVPAAIVAKDLINQRDDILGDYRIEFIVSDSGCNVSTKAVNGFLKEVFHPMHVANTTLNIVGIIGPGCSEATIATATLVSDDHLSLIQIAPSATSPILTNTTAFPNTFRPIVSALGFVDTYIKFIKRRGYGHVGALYEAGRPFQTTVYTHFREKAEENGIKLKSFGLFDDYFPLNEFLFNLRIIFVFASSSFAHQLLCLAYHNKMFFPEYQFIFSNRKPQNFFQNVKINGTECNQMQMKMVVTGMIFSDFRLRRPNRTETNTHPGISYEEFNERYSQIRSCHLIELGLNDTVHTEHHSGYFDATWALALALNNSQPRLKEKGISLLNYSYQMPVITRIIKDELLNLSFEGMRGRVEFSKETNDGANVTIIDIHQVLETDTPYSLVGEYNPTVQESSLTFFYSDSALLQKEYFDLIHVMPHHSLGILVLIATVLLFIVLFACHIASVVWRQYRTVKASSPRLNHLMFAGCYFAISGTIVYTNISVFIEFSEENMEVLAVHCIALQWATTLLNPLMFGVLCIKTWRVYCIFYKYNSLLTEYLNDRILLLIALLPLILKIVLNILWSVINPWQFVQDPRQDSDLLPIGDCRTENQPLWTVVVTIPQGILTVLVLYLAIATRGVRKQEFKKTKSINILLFCLLLLNGTVLPFSYVLRQGVTHHSIWRIAVSYVCFCLWLLGSVSLCIVFLLLPPLIPLIKDKIHYKTTPLTPV